MYKIYYGFCISLCRALRRRGTYFSKQRQSDGMIQVSATSRPRPEKGKVKLCHLICYTSVLTGYEACDELYHWMNG